MENELEARVQRKINALQAQITANKIIIRSGLEADRPALTGSGQLYWATDTEVMYYDPPI